jgi:tripartite ATP-independent transporter DctM subunit
MSANMHKRILSTLAVAERQPVNHPQLKPLLKIAIDAHLAWHVIAMQEEGSSPKPPQRFSPAGLLKWIEQKIAAVKRAAPVLVLMAAVFGGLYSGVFTVNEAASVAAVLSLAFAAARGRMDRESLWRGIRESASATAMIYVIIIGASIFTYTMTIARVPEALINLIGGLTVSPLVVIFALLVAYLILGAVFDEIAAMLITLPFVLPIIEQLGYDAIWWGIINVVVIELGMIIPPIGIIVFILHGLAPQISLRTIYRGVVPFILADLVLLALLTLFPEISLALPRALK